MPAEQESAVVPNGSEATEQADTLPALSGEQMSRMMTKLGIPSGIRPTVVQEQETPPPEEPPPIETPPVETPAVQVPPEEEELKPAGETKPEDDDDDDGEPQKGKPIDVAKLQRRNYKLRQRARRAEDEAVTLKQKLDAAEKQPPVTIAPTLQDPLVHISDLQQLEAERQQFKILRDVARNKPDGWIANEGTSQEYVVSPEQARQYLSYAEDVLSEHFPRKEKEIAQVRPAAIAEARKVLPAMYDRSTEDYQAAQVLKRQLPILSIAPQGDYYAAVLLRGFRAIAADQAAAQKNGSKLEVPEKILKAHAERQSTPVQRQTPPGRVTTTVIPKSDAISKAVERVNKTGGSREAIADAMKAFRTANPARNGREAVSV